MGDMSEFLSRLKGVMRRTQRDVAVAGAAIKVATPILAAMPVKQPYSELKLTFKNGAMQWWTVAPCERSDGVWNDFLRWFHGRPQSAFYVMHTREGSNCVPRCEIRHYDITYGTKLA